MRITSCDLLAPTSAATFIIEDLCKVTDLDAEPIAALLWYYRAIEFEIDLGNLSVVDLGLAKSWLKQMQRVDFGIRFHFLGAGERVVVGMRLAETEDDYGAVTASIARKIKDMLRIDRVMA